jgi:hypothetical protein
MLNNRMQVMQIYEMIEKGHSAHTGYLVNIDTVMKNKIQTSCFCRIMELALLTLIVAATPCR